MWPDQAPLRLTPSDEGPVDENTRKELFSDAFIQALTAQAWLGAREAKA
jgi:hypothetical protein